MKSERKMIQVTKSVMRQIGLTIGMALLGNLLTLPLSADNELHSQKVEFFAFRTSVPLPEVQWKALTSEIADTGIDFVSDRSLDHHQILVFRGPLGSATYENLEVLLSGMVRIPVNEYYDKYGIVYSVSSGFYYLRFDETISSVEARARLVGAGFKVVSPISNPTIVVEGTRRPEDKEAELQRLKQLSNLRYVASDDIPLNP
jgi:hypothetical protein